MAGLIIKAVSGVYDGLINGQTIVCKPLGVFRHQEKKPKVGDLVEIENQTIVEILPRISDLQRPFISNVTKVFIITSLVEPDLNLNLLDRLISLVEWENLKIVLVFTKKDKTDVSLYQSVLTYYQNLGYPVYLMPGAEEPLLDEIKDQICVVAGQSGVGKSHLINSLHPLFTQKTGEISKALGRGKHTTRHIELLSVAGGWIADTPGFGILDLKMDVASLSHTFREFFACKCRFPRCYHLAEPGCAVKEKVKNKEILKSRYQNYLGFVKEIQYQKKY